MIVRFAIWALLFWLLYITIRRVLLPKPKNIKDLKNVREINKNDDHHSPVTAVPDVDDNEILHLHGETKDDSFLSDEAGVESTGFIGGESACTGNLEHIRANDEQVLHEKQKLLVESDFCEREKKHSEHKQPLERKVEISIVK